MSEAAPIDRDAQMLARLAELDLSAAEHVHGRLVATEETAQIDVLGRTYQRIARSLRQTLALKAKLAKEQRLATSPFLQKQFTPSSIQDFRTDERIMDIQDAAERIAGAAVPGDPEGRETLLERFDRELDDWTLEDDFTEADLDSQVRRACRVMGLPEELAADWRSLPRPDDPFEDDDDDLAAVPNPAAPDPSSSDPPPWSNSA